MLSARLALAAALLVVAAPAFAQDGPPPPPQDDDALRVVVGGGVLVTPDFQGSSEHRTRALPYISVDYGERVSASVQGGATVELVRAGDFVAGPMARFRFGQDEDDSDGLQGLGDVDPSLELGGFVGYRRGPWSVRLAAGQDVIGGHEGAVAELSGAFTTPIARTGAGPVLLSAGPSVTFVTSEVNRAFFGVDMVQSAASGLPVYEPSGGLQQAGASATLIVALTQRISVVGFAGYGRLLDDAADSPRVTERGSPDQVSGGLFLTYRF